MFQHQGISDVGCSVIVMGGILPLSRVLVVCLGTLVVPLDSMVNLDFPSIIQRFGLGIPEIQWLVISYTLTHASLLLVFGRIGDMIGHRRIFLAGTTWSAVAFALCGAAPSYAWLLFARCLQGVGAGLVLSCGAALVTGFVAEERRARVLGLYTMMFGLGSALGPLLAGVMVSRWGWSAVFWARAPIALASCALGFVLPTPTPAAALALPRPAQRERFDAIGAALLVLTIGTLLLTLNRLRTPQVAAAYAVVTLAALWGFIRQERRVAQPIIDLRLFRIAGFAAVNLGHALMNLAGFAIMLLMPFYLDRVAGLPALSLGLVLAIGSLGIVLAAPIAGRLAGQLNPRRLTVAGALCAMTGLGAIAALAGQVGVAALAAAMFVQGFGQGLFQVAYFDIVTGTIPRRDRGVAGSLGMLTRTGGVVLGATVLMLAFQTLRGMAGDQGASDAPAFLFGFRGAFALAATLTAVVLVMLGVRVHR
ncbi:MAG TPA: MFS transporter [Acetobacteraceae bacterium]|nr:MFS transporter [Acetobacteraceae bacterium]